MLDGRIASASNMIIQKSYFKKNVSLEEQKAQKEDRFLRGRQSACMIHDYVRVTGAHDTVLDYADLFSITLRDDDVQDFDTRWDEILLSITKIPLDEILESLYKLRILESDQLKTVLELYHMEIHQKITIPNYQKLKTMVSPSGKTNRLPCKNFLKGTCTSFLVTFGILPNVNSTSLNRGVNSAQSARFRTGRLRNNQIKGRRRMVRKVQWL